MPNTRCSIDQKPKKQTNTQWVITVTMSRSVEVALYIFLKSNIVPSPWRSCVVKKGKIGKMRRTLCKTEIILFTAANADVQKLLVGWLDTRNSKWIWQPNVCFCRKLLRPGVGGSHLSAIAYQQVKHCHIHMCLRPFRSSLAAADPWHAGSPCEKWRG